MRIQMRLAPLFASLLLALALVEITFAPLALATQPAASRQPGTRDASSARILAASCSQDDVQAAIDSAAKGDTVLVPPGSCTWTTTQANTPAVAINDKALTLQGAGVDQTTITDGTGYEAFEQALVIDAAPGKFVRVTGFTFQGGHSEEWHGLLNIWGASPSAQFRVDHVKFADTINHTLEVGNAAGVIDHCRIEGNAGGILVKSEYPGDASRQAPLELGSPNAVYIEDCTFEFQASYRAAIDAQSGGRFVFRHNTLINTYVGNHGTESGYPERGVFSYEIYENTLESPEDWFTAMFLRGGTGVIFNNTVQGYGNLIVAANYRSCAPYGIWGQCSGGSSYDGNAESNGYPCYDQIGRATDSGPGTPQALEPLYEWGNTLDGVDEDITVHWGCPEVNLHLQENRDFYNDTLRPGYTPYTYPHPLTQELVLSGIPADQAIYLSWSVTAALPLTATWQIAYAGPPGDQASPISGLPEPTRTYTLTGLTNYTPYTVTLNAMLDSTPVLTGTLTLMPSDLGVRFPLLMKQP